MCNSDLYHLVHPDRPGIVLYAGRHKDPPVRIVEHREGKCKTTANRAKRDGLDISKIEMLVIRQFNDDLEPQAEGNEIALLQALGQAQWNYPNTIKCNASQNGKLGIKKMTREDRARGVRNRNLLHGNPATPESRAKGGRAGGKRTHELYGSTFTLETCSKGGRRRNELYGHPGTRYGSQLGARNGNHNRWHVQRGIMNPNCVLCKAA